MLSWDCPFNGRPVPLRVPAGRLCVVQELVQGPVDAQPGLDLQPALAALLGRMVVKRHLSGETGPS